MKFNKYNHFELIKMGVFFFKFNLIYSLINENMMIKIFIQLIVLSYINPLLALSFPLSVNRFSEQEKNNSGEKQNSRNMCDTPYYWFYFTESNNTKNIRD